MRFDLVVVGLGHAGCEAALAASRMGLSVLAVTFSREQIGLMSCNPSVGGPGKGQLVRELDALGGEMARAADAAGIHFRRLNESKGLAVRARRAICDRARYAAEMGRRLLGIEVVEGEAISIVVENGHVRGVVARTKKGRQELAARAIVVTAGTFLSGVMHVGERSLPGGRVGDAASRELSVSLASLGLRMGRFKTGTPGRLDGRTIDWARTESQPGDTNPLPFSFSTVRERFPRLEQRSCGITYTNPATHKVILASLDRSPLFTGRIVGKGPRYCPSIEDKVVRFAHRERHQIFLEPDGLDTDVVYPAGVSTSLPEEVQRASLRTIVGLEEVKLLSPGYAVEYDFVDPTQLEGTLQAASVEGLWLAGQVVGSSGYEEAAVQGFVAGVNAARWIRGEAPFRLGRAESLIGVLIDDLVTRGVEEPYRMFTSRAEHRLLIREENADLRLARHGAALGLVGVEQIARVERKRRNVASEIERLKATTLNPSTDTRRRMETAGLTPLGGPTSLAGLLRRPELDYRALAPLDPERPALDDETIVEVETEIRYAGYIERQEEWVRQAEKMERVQIPEGFAFDGVRGLTREVQEKLLALTPKTLGEASRIPGMTPASLGLLAIHVRRALSASCQYVQGSGKSN